MAGYATIEAAIQTAIRTLSSDFASADVVRGDFSVIDKGSATKKCAIITFLGSRTLDRGGAGRRATEWNTRVQIFQRYNTMTDSRAALITLVDTVYQKLESYPTLNGTAGVNAVTISIDGEPAEVRQASAPPDSAPQFLMQSMTLSTIEVWNATGGEY